MHRTFLMYGAVFGGLAVALGAFGAHGLENITGDEKILHAYQTAVQYQMYHALALLLTGILYGKTDMRWARRAAYCFITGVILFSGSLYLLTFLKIQQSHGTRFVGPLTPIGGLFFIAGWLSLLVAFVRNK